MRLNEALTLNPTLFPNGLETVTHAGKVFTTTESVTKFLNKKPAWALTFSAIAFDEIGDLTVEQLKSLYDKFRALDINLSLKDSIIPTQDGYLLDVFGYGLVIRCMKGDDLLTNLTKLLTEMATQKAEV